MKISNWATRFCFLPLLALSLSAHAQNGVAPPPGVLPGAPPEETPVQSAATRIYVAEENALNALPGVLQRGPGAVSLRASDEALNANAGARAALLRYVSSGGTVFLHTDAAREFGYTTVQAREGTSQVAGQLFGRARAAVPFGAHPLLWDDGVTPTRRTVNSDPTQLPGVNVVFYQLRPGDDLVVSHPAGTPLLEVSDLGSNIDRPLYAAAIAPYGRGFAVFTPDSLNLRQGDGALFARNLLGLLAPTEGVGRKWVGIPARVVEGGAANPAALRAALVQAATYGGPRVVPALPAFGTAAPAPNAPVNVIPLPVAPPETNADTNTTTNTQRDIETDNAAIAAGVDPADVVPEVTVGAVTNADAQVLISRAEANQYAAILGAGGDRAAVVTNLLRARLFMSRGDGIEASRAIEASAGFAPQGSADEASIALWRGVLLAGASQQIAQSSQARASQLAEGARNLAVGVRSLRAAPRPNTDPEAPPANDVGLTAEILQSWSTKCALIAQVFALEPPGVRQYGVGDASITLRGFPNDNTIELLDLGIRALANARNFGWRADREEILLFPTIQTFNNYRRALNLGEPTVPLPAGAAGDVLGQRLIMVAVPSFPLVEQDQQTGERRVFALGNNTANVFARLHSYILLNALDEGGTNVPVYLQLGLENIINRIIDGPRPGDNTNILEQFAQNGGLLAPNQFVANQTDPVRYQLAQLQASGIVAYLYNQYGAGSFAEIIQRLGAGQNIGDALEDVTENDETALFQDWRDAQFGPRRFPNRG